MDAIIGYIGQIGFPIVLCLLLWKELGDERESHKEETSKLAEVINNNTQALIKLADKLAINIDDGEGRH